MERRYHFLAFGLFLISLSLHQQAYANDAAAEEDQVEKGILGRRQTLQARSRHFVGKFDVFGKTRYSSVQTEKPPRIQNPHVIVWNKEVKVVPGSMPLDIPEAFAVPSNIEAAAKFGNPCKKPSARYPVLNATTASQGPKAEKMKRNNFRPCNERKSKAERAGTRLGSFSGRFKRSESYSYPSMLWKSNTIPYAIDSNVPESLNETITAALQLWAEKTCLVSRKVEVPASTSRKIRSVMTEGGQILDKNEPYMLFTSGGGACSSNRLGPSSGTPEATEIDISTCGDKAGAIAHAIGHALGLGHSHRRVGRDASVKVFMPNVATAWRSEFEEDNAKYFDSWGVPYYYDSVMHYSPYAASKNGLMTICPLDPLMEVLMGQREGPSTGDISLINYMYCRESCFNEKQMAALQYQGNRSRTISERTCQNWSSQSPHKHNFTSVGNHSSCRNPDGWEGGPWCYTNDPAVRYEPCFSSCEDMKKLNFPACPGWCYNGGYHDQTNCTCVCPSHTFGEFCENVDSKLQYDHLPCGGKMELKTRQDKITITSPGYPRAYPANTLCMWWLQGPVGSQIRLTIAGFALEKADDKGCFDYLEIRPSICATAIEHPDKMRFCGASLAPRNLTALRLHSDDNNMVLKFYTDATGNFKGFKAIARIVRAA